MRHKNAADEFNALWINEAQKWENIDGELTLVIGAITWMDEGIPWAVFSADEVVYNVDVGEYIRIKGP
jgi:hypothetical protein